MFWRYELFVPLMMCLSVFAWFGHGAVTKREAKKYFTFALGTLLIASLSLLILLTVFIPLLEGHTQSLSIAQLALTLVGIVAAHLLAVVPTALTLYSFGAHWPREVHLGAAIGMSAVATFFLPRAMLVFGCALLRDCL